MSLANSSSATCFERSPGIASGEAQAFLRRIAYMLNSGASFIMTS
jgi:hypothetical protein